VLCVFALLGLVAGCGNSSDGSGAKVAATPAPHADKVIVMQGLKFAPTRVTIRKGQTVEWVDKDLVDHSVAAKGIDSPDFAQGETWSHTFARAGVFRYHDRLNPSMKGTVIVRR
jgi:plastocyanin